MLSYTLRKNTWPIYIQLAAQELLTNFQQQKIPEKIEEIYIISKDSDGKTDYSTLAELFFNKKYL